MIVILHFFVNFKSRKRSNALLKQALMICIISLYNIYFNFKYTFLKKETAFIEKDAVNIFVIFSTGYF